MRKRKERRGERKEDNYQYEGKYPPGGGISYQIESHSIPHLDRARDTE